MIFVWQAETGQLIAKQGLHSPLSRVRFLPGESILVSSDEGGKHFLVVTRCGYVV